MPARNGNGRDVYQDVTDRIVAALEGGVVPWHQPWRSAGGPRNLNSGRRYRGINPFILEIASLAHGYDDPRWATFRGIKKAGGHVRKGEHGTLVILWKRFEVDDRDNPGERKSIAILRSYTVFNVAQADWDEPLPALVAVEDHEPIAAAEAIVAGYHGPAIKDGRPSYDPIEDVVTIPPMGHFEDAESFYGALYHELVHSTGHESRLDRLDKSSFGSDPYAKEELVAELGAAMLAGSSGLAPRIEASASYIASWLTALRNDSKLVVSAAAQAQRAADLITGETFDEAETATASEGVTA